MLPAGAPQEMGRALPPFQAALPGSAQARAGSRAAGRGAKRQQAGGRRAAGGDGAHCQLGSCVCCLEAAANHSLQLK